MQRIDTLDDIKAGLEALCASDSRLIGIRRIAGEVPLRRSPPGFESLASNIVAQQVSTASARAIFGRLIRLIDPLEPTAVLAADEAVFREIGLSRPKQRTLLAVSESVIAGDLDLEALCLLDPENAIRQMTAVPGIGPWTAEVYLLFSAGHPDIFPARDVALQAAVATAFDLPARPSDKELTQLAESWAPWRGVAARLFWAFYRETRGREGVLDATTGKKS